MNRWLKDEGLRPTPKHVIYSFRHGFADRLRKVECPIWLQDSLMGHAPKGENYGEGAKLDQARDWLSRAALAASWRTAFSLASRVFNRSISLSSRSNRSKSSASNWGWSTIICASVVNADSARFSVAPSDPAELFLVPPRFWCRAAIVCKKPPSYEIRKVSLSLRHPHYCQPCHRPGCASSTRCFSPSFPTTRVIWFLVFPFEDW